MRDIKFRGLDVLTGEWVKGSHVQTGTGMHFILPQNLIADSIPNYYVDNETVGQYTGLKDKNGKELYFDDCIVFQYGNHKDSLVWDIKYMSDLVYLINEVDERGANFEIIGNIHENPELLEV
ncbi:YopX family protein [Cytobacillus firmus]|uniref:YopX family protein n=1 Tax=Cytobacillus firmus TaxID=1399 RepID=UPI003683FE33